MWNCPIVNSKRLLLMKKCPFSLYRDLASTEYTTRVVYETKSRKFGRAFFFFFFYIRITFYSSFAYLANCTTIFCFVIQSRTVPNTVHGIFLFEWTSLGKYLMVLKICQRIIGFVWECICCKSSSNEVVHTARAL